MKTIVNLQTLYYQVPITQLFIQIFEEFNKQLSKNLYLLNLYTLFTWK